MNTSPSLDQLLEGAIIAIDDEILPALGNAKAQATAVMLQSLLQGIRQTLPVMDRHLVDEHNGMTRALRDAAAALGDAVGPAADRIRERGGTIGRWDDLPAPLDREAVMGAHRALGRALEATMLDLDELQRAGAVGADEALQIVRGHLGPRFVRDVETFTVGEGFIGRG